MRTIAIIQARMGSTRLPGKVMKDLCGHPVIEWVVRRVSKAKLLDHVIVAIPESDISSLFMSNYRTFYGPEHDVLARFYHCARSYDADYIVRITADCPLIDWQTIDSLVEFLWLNREYQFVSNTSFRKYIPRGLDVEVFTWQMLALTHHLAAEKSKFREHVCPGIKYMYPAKCTRLQRPDSIEKLGHLRWTLDEEDDLKMLNSLCAHGNWDTPWWEFAKICEKHPEIPAINADVLQKEVST